MINHSLIYLSRNFTEFGPFSPAEIHDFKKRGLTDVHDFVRPHGSSDWLHMEDWLAKKTTTNETTPVKAKKSAKKAVSKKSAKPAVKAARKTAS